MIIPNQKIFFACLLIGILSLVLSCTPASDLDYNNAPLEFSNAIAIQTDKGQYNTNDAISVKIINGYDYPIYYQKPCHGLLRLTRLEYADYVPVSFKTQADCDKAFEMLNPRRLIEYNLPADMYEISGGHVYRLALNYSTEPKSNVTKQMLEAYSNEFSFKKPEKKEEKSECLVDADCPNNYVCLSTYEAPKSKRCEQGMKCSCYRLCSSKTDCPENAPTCTETNIEDAKKVCTNLPDKEECDKMENEIKQLLDEINHCVKDSDCIISDGFGCPFGCYTFYNKQESLSGVVEKTRAFRAKGCFSCEYECMNQPSKEEIGCFENKCIDLRFRNQ